jgi:signal transduction histidine kinase
MKLRISLILKVLAIVAFTFAGTLFFLLSKNLEHTKNSFMESERDKARIILQTLMPLVSINESFGFGSSIDEQVKELKRLNPSIIDILIDKRAGEQELTRAVEGDHIVESQVIRDYFDPKKQIGTITIVYSNRHYHSLLEQYKVDIVYSVVAVGMILVLLSGLLYYSFLPLKRLASLVNNYDFTKNENTLEKLTCKDEVGDISNALSELLTRMSGYARELGELNDHLQEKVDEQTSELIAFNEKLKEKIDEAVEKIRIQDMTMIKQSRHAAMGEMIGNIAHQWKQPLNALGIIVQDIKDANNYGELDKAYIDTSVKRAMEQVYDMDRTINDFKNFFSPEKQRKPFSLKQAIAYAQRMIESNLRKQNIMLIVEGEDREVMGYQNELVQVFINIFNNARDVFEEKEMNENAQIRVRIKEVSGQVVLEIEDNAGGIPEDVMGKIFDPYFSTKPEEKGTGIGLYMSKMIMEESMQGRLEAANTSNGACFTLTLEPPTQDA